MAPTYIFSVDMFSSHSKGPWNVGERQIEPSWDAKTWIHVQTYKHIYIYTVYIFVDMSYIHPRIYLKLINFWDHAFMYDMILFYLPVYFWNSHMSCFPDFLFPFSAHTLRLQPHLLFHLSLGSKKWFSFGAHMASHAMTYSIKTVQSQKTSLERIQNLL